jgi:hypothetical protein
MAPDMETMSQAPCPHILDRKVDLPFYEIMKKYHGVPPEVKEPILLRIKEEGITVEQVAKDAGIHPTTI